MRNSKLFVRTGISFADAQQALEHIGLTMLNAGVVHDSYPQALLARERDYPTGIALEQHAVAIPHCEAEHARAPAIYLIRPDRTVPFAQADDDGTIAVSLIIALIVTDPAAQLVLLRTLFGQLQHPEFINALLTAPEDQLGEIFAQKIFTSPSPSQPQQKTEYEGATL
ncbi:PTS system galactitol-specific EIIA component (Gat family) [Serratia fonticola]|jgi:PTS system galactitol-specific IIA component|uniref:PTS system galactitol-specific EIIA component (Gat family) n=1 Tax=Serratia fonticola TaxID=47917 RepID=A0A559T504_SERFO|nr:PTS galactitol transporter subunit IIA [Serratia fonticola]TQI77818.1 PTS system galactitol-specific EIIA component (Gat family) [Serratia fonticola]TQI95186.1 PTS system galactitol-specific EIIA component (Gat family) [Serratia fonticola]TVZ69684.1 PTS system galactitol-specific EIIA component (Gat family) [Serratia fonticola]